MQSSLLTSSSPTESQHVEYKSVWKDDYLKWICGFANAQGGTLFIGVNDQGQVVGVNHVQKLLEDLPNKIKLGLGLVTQVNHRALNGLDYLEIKVEPSAYPVSYRGEFFVRSGSTLQQLTGFALTSFISRQTGFLWEDVTVDQIKVEDLDEESFRIFKREALRIKRMTEQDLNVSNEVLLDKLNLLSEGKLKRSAVLLFYKNPAVVQSGSHVQVGKFTANAEVAYDDVLEGSLIETADKVVDLIYWKYLKAKISYEHDRRRETYPYARAAIREAIFNAMVHNCYMYGAPIQIRIEDEQMVISNCCSLPPGWTAETLMHAHSSQPYNPTIAGVFYRAGFIEHWGRGIEKICAACRELGADLPRYELLGNTLRVHFKALSATVIGSGEESVPSQDVGKSISKVSVDTLTAVNDSLETNILYLLRINPQIKQSEIALKLNVSSITVKRAFGRLVLGQKIVREGGKRYGHWRVISKEPLDSGAENEE